MLCPRKWVCSHGVRFHVVIVIVGIIRSTSEEMMLQAVFTVQALVILVVIVDVLVNYRLFAIV